MFSAIRKYRKETYHLLIVRKNILLLLAQKQQFLHLGECNGNVEKADAAEYNLMDVKQHPMNFFSSYERAVFPIPREVIAHGFCKNVSSAT